MIYAPLLTQPAKTAELFFIRTISKNTINRHGRILSKQVGPSYNFISKKLNFHSTNNMLNVRHIYNYYTCYISYRSLSQNSKQTDVVPPSRKEQFKRLIAEYGSTVVVFHIVISLTSLGLCYLLVSSGINMSVIMNSIGFGNMHVPANAGTFIVAYGVHKLLVPVRLSLTIMTTPFIVRYLRQKGFLKKM